MNAGELAAKYGKSLIGREIVTQHIGKFPGGLRKILEVEPDRESAVFTVDWCEEDIANASRPGFGTMSICEWEQVHFMSQLRDDGTFDDSYDHHASAR